MACSTGKTDVLITQVDFGAVSNRAAQHWLCSRRVTNPDSEGPNGAEADAHGRSPGIRDGRFHRRTDAKAQSLLPDDLRSLIEGHLPAYSRSPKGGRPQINDRAALTCILFFLKTGIPWEYLPRELGCGSGMTCWRRLRNGGRFCKNQRCASIH